MWFVRRPTLAITKRTIRTRRIPEVLRSDARCSLQQYRYLLTVLGKYKHAFMINTACDNWIMCLTSDPMDAFYWGVTPQNEIWDLLYDEYYG